MNSVLGKPSWWAAALISSSHSRVKIQPRCRRKISSVGCSPTSSPKVRWLGALAEPNRPVTGRFQTASGICCMAPSSQEVARGMQPNTPRRSGLLLAAQARRAVVADRQVGRVGTDVERATLAEQFLGQ